MRRTLCIALITASSSLAASAALAQNTTVVVEPVPQRSNVVISAPIEYDANGVAKAQYFKAEDLSPEELAALYAEADRVRGYQQANGVYVRPETAAAPTLYQTAAPTVTPTQSYEVELYAQPTHAPNAQPLITAHVVSKGDTLYNISRRYGVSVSDLQQANGISGSSISLGQQINIPAAKMMTRNTSAPSITVASTPVSQTGTVTRRVVEPAFASEPVRSVTSATNTVYAVLPKDTLYAISRRTCTAVPTLIAANAIANPNALKPGQRLSIPAGHCLTN